MPEEPLASPDADVRDGDVGSDDVPDGDDVVQAVDLPDGRHLVVRRASPDDAAGVHALYEHLSTDDLRRRFFLAHVPPRHFADEWVRVAERGGVALVVDEVDPDGTAELVAEAGYSMLADGDGEFGITVAPSCRGWIGPWLLDHLIEQARRNGVPNLHADVLSSNRAMLSVIRHRGWVTEDHPDLGQVRLVISTSGTTPGWPPEHDKPRLLVEAPHGFWRGEHAAHEAGFDVRTCAGPDEHVGPCPVLEGEPCPLVEGADAVVVVRSPAAAHADELLARHRLAHPELVVVVPGEGDDGPDETAAHVVERVRKALGAGAERIAGDGEPDEPGDAPDLGAGTAGPA